MGTRLDPARITELQELMGDQIEDLAANLVESISSSIDGSARALEAGDLAEATAAAHHCRNDVLLIGARDLLEPLQELERAARAGRSPEAKSALRRAQALWPQTRQELERLIAAR
jgi:HPt (histidine-containing phosphotransfer) domain-containing protein